MFVWGGRLLNTTVVLSTGTLLLLNTKAGFVEHLRAERRVSVDPGTHGADVRVGPADPGSGTRLCAPEWKCFQRFGDRGLFAIVGPGFTFCSCRENFKCVCCRVLPAVCSCAGWQGCSQSRAGAVRPTVLHVKPFKRSRQTSRLHVCPDSETTAARSECCSLAGVSP